VVDHGFFITLQAVRRQLTAMPHELYLVRLIHATTSRACPGERLWTASILSQPATLRFLRARNRDGFDVYFHPYSGDRNSGYLLLDLDEGDTHTIDAMRAHGHPPCVVLQSSPGHLQAWVRISAATLDPALATAAARQLARLYRGDAASADWRHLGRLAGFTNQKPHRRLPNGFAPWVKLLHASQTTSTHGTGLLLDTAATGNAASHAADPLPLDCSLTPTAASAIYQFWLHRLRIPQRFPKTDFSIADLWIAKQLLRIPLPPPRVAAILQLGSPGFPRRHSDPHDYLRRTLARAARELLSAPPFPGRGRPLCGPHLALPAATPSAAAFRSNSAGGT